MKSFAENLRHRLPLLAILVALPACAPFGGLAAQPSGDDLVQNSPFLPEGYRPPGSERTPPVREPPPQAPRGPEPLDQIEFRGLTRFGGTTQFSLFDPNEKRSYWIELNGTEGGFTVAEYKAGEEAVVVQHEGKTRTIPLHESKIAPLAPETPRPEGRNRDRPREQAQRPENPEERMRNLAEEIQRRREARRALLEQARDEQQQGNN